VENFGDIMSAKASYREGQESRYLQALQLLHGSDWFSCLNPHPAWMTQ
jgi:hypothetical protein